MTMSRVLPNPRHYYHEALDHHEKIDYDDFCNAMVVEKRFQTFRRRGYPDDNTDTAACFMKMKTDIRSKDAPIAENSDKTDRSRTADQNHVEIDPPEIDYGYGDAEPCVIKACEAVGSRSISGRRRFSIQCGQDPSEIDYGYGDAPPTCHSPNNVARHPIASRRSSLKSSNSVDPTVDGAQQPRRLQQRRLSFGGNITILIDQKLPTTEAPLKKQNRWHDGTVDTSPQLKSKDRWGECTLQRSNSSNSMPMMPRRRNN
jgi:hypothetical protein